jgi:diaminopimelate epimerase
MSSLPFIKMQAQGNDFVILDGLSHPLPELDTELIMRLADRRLGIGCDQVLVLHVSDTADAAMHIFNADGSEAGNCGNGLRCVGSLLLERTGSQAVRIVLPDRIVSASRGEKGIRVEMGKATISDHNDAHVDIEIGNAHRVFFEATEQMPEGRNIEIVSGQGEDHAWIEIIERGVGHTPACGSGACAVAVAIWSSEGHNRPQSIIMPGGEVTVSGTPDSLVLEGKVSRSFEGVFELN